MRQGFAKNKREYDEIPPMEEKPETPSTTGSLINRVKSFIRKPKRDPIEDMTPRGEPQPVPSQPAHAGHKRPKVTEAPVEPRTRPKVTEEEIPKKPPQPSFKDRMVDFGKKAAPVLKDVAVATGSAIKTGVSEVGKGVAAHNKWVNDSNYENTKRRLEIAQMKASLRRDYGEGDDDASEPFVVSEEENYRIPPGAAQRYTKQTQQQEKEDPKGNYIPSQQYRELSRRQQPPVGELPDDLGVEDEQSFFEQEPRRKPSRSGSVLRAGMTGLGQGLRGELEPMEPPQYRNPPQRRSAPSMQETQAGINDILGLSSPRSRSRSPSMQETQAGINDILGLSSSPSSRPAKPRGDIMQSTDIMASIFGTSVNYAPTTGRGGGTTKTNKQIMNSPDLALSIMGVQPSAPRRQAPPPPRAPQSQPSKIGQKKAARATTQSQKKSTKRKGNRR